MSEFVFRVYEPFHESSESGTYEYGTYSSYEDAATRLEAMWSMRGYPQPEEKSEWDWYADFQMDTYRMYISKVEIDRDTNDELTGYT